MKTILVPVDINEVSANALVYAMRCYPKSDIHIVHVKSSLDSEEKYQVEGQLVPSEEYWKSEVSDYMEAKLKLPKLPANVILHIRYGNVTSEIIRIADSLDIDQIVMGTRDKYKLLDKWIGTESLAVIKRAKQSIMLIPRYAVYKPYEKVLVASDKSLKDPEVSRKIMNWNSKYNAYLRFIHVTNSVHAYKEEKSAIVDTLFEDRLPSFGFEIALLKSDDVVSPLLGSAYNFGANLLIAMPTHESPIQTLFFKSISKELIEKAQIPVLYLK